MTDWKIDGIDETEEALTQRVRLKRVREFLLENEADDDLLETIDIAIDDINNWISSDIEAALDDGVLQPGEA